jgi:LytTR family transcriptional regulator, CO-responsive transcriptional regulator RcoM
VDARAAAGSGLHLLERSDVGLVQLDRDLKVVAMNSFARRSLPLADKQLLAKISKMSDLMGCTLGYTLVFCDITEAVSLEEPGAPRADTRRQLMKIPTVSGNRIVLVDAASVRFVRAEGHYTWVHTAQGSSFCNLTIGDLEGRLDTGSFLRIHRSYLANLDFADEIVRDDGKVTLKLSGGGDHGLPVARASVPRLLERLGITEPAGER